MHSGPHRSPPVLLILSAHPGPSVAVTLICIVLGISTGLEPWRIAVIGFAIPLGQFSVGLSNDWLDAERDFHAGRADKPVARGWISVSAVRAAAFIAGAAGIAVTSVLGGPATLAHALFIAAGWAYNLWLKRTVLSVLPYLVGFGALPAVVTLAQSTPMFPKLWVVAAGGLLGIAAHFANVLPDLDDDRLTGVVGLPHLLGARASGIITFAALAAATVLTVSGPEPSGLGDFRSIIAWGALGVEALIVAVGVVLAATKPPARPLFQLVVLGAFVAVASVALSGTQLTAS
ncbi:MAG: UbiA family prenyltransferase [Cryobacterium sp.]|nr:UbiA family prenyltransferase [Cryobacterium sp.]